MDFHYNAEQQMLADTVGRFAETDYDFETRRKLAKSERGFSEDNWNAMVEMGLFAINVPEEFGGLSGTPVDTLIVMEAFGRGLVIEPYLSTAVVAASLINAAGNAAQKKRLLGAIAEGRCRFALAALEPQSRFDLWDVATRAKVEAGRYVLNGRKAVVLSGDSADTLIVSARTSGGATDQAGISLFLVDANAVGVTVKGFPNIDGQRSAEVTLRDVSVGADALLGPLDEGFAPLEWAVDYGIAALCAEAAGAMSKLLDITGEYLRTRKQFGKPLGTFQALQHAAADMLAALEQSRSVALMAAAKVNSSAAVERRAAISTAKALVGQAGRRIGKHAVQLHGGMGMTEELAVGHYFKRLLCIDLTWGDSDHHIEQYARLM